MLKDRVLEGFWVIHDKEFPFEGLIIQGKDRDEVITKLQEIYACNGKSYHGTAFIHPLVYVE